VDQEMFTKYAFCMKCNEVYPLMIALKEPHQNVHTLVFQITLVV